jgi:TRAP-type C4-dicarboxylate transport system permease small subunit
VSALLDRLYNGAGYLAGAFMVLILLSVLAGIFGRLLAIDTPGMDAYAGYSMAASSFLALAHTLRRGEHIRVTLVLQHLGARARWWLELAAHAIALCLTFALAWFSVRLVWLSRVYNDVSQGLDATPLWIPQIGMAAGAALLALAFAQGLVECVRGRPTPAGTPAQAVRAE